MLRFLDPFLFIGILLLFIYKYSGIWLANNSPNDQWYAYLLNTNLVSGWGGIVALLIGIIRPIVRSMLQGQYTAAAFFYGAFWFVLALPVVCLGSGVGDTVTGRLYWMSFLALFLVTNFLIVVCVAIARCMPSKK